MKKLGTLMAMAAAMGAFGGIPLTSGHDLIPTEPETDTERKNRLAIADAKRNRANGLNQYQYGTEYVWAINQKNADKKAKKLGYI